MGDKQNFSIEITYDQELDSHISDDERQILIERFVATAKETIQTDRTLSFIDGPTQVIPAPNTVVVTNIIKTTDTAIESEEEDVSEDAPDEPDPVRTDRRRTS